MTLVLINPIEVNKDGKNNVDITEPKGACPFTMQTMWSRMGIPWKESIPCQMYLLWHNCNGWELESWLIIKTWTWTVLGSQAVGFAEMTTTLVDWRLLSLYSNSTAYNNSLCPVCDGNHNVLVISLENGGRIVTHPFPKEKAIKAKITYGRRRATRLHLVDTFWPSNEEGNGV